MEILKSELSFKDLKRQYYLMFDQLPPFTMGLYEDDPIYVELMKEAIVLKRPIKIEDLEKKIEASSRKIDLVN